MSMLIVVRKYWYINEKETILIEFIVMFTFLFKSYNFIFISKNCDSKIYYNDLMLIKLVLTILAIQRKKTFGINGNFINHCIIQYLKK